jgi:hypothetical protein
MVVNHYWLAREIPAAETDDEPLGYREFVMLAGMVRKSTLDPEQMARAGFQYDGPPNGPPSVVTDSIIYWADVEDLRLTEIGATIGIPGSALPKDDGRVDWRAEYVRLLRASQAMPVPDGPPPVPPVERAKRVGRRLLTRLPHRVRPDHTR